VLPDGTVAELAAGAEIAVEFEPQYRFVTLRRGTAHFDVAPNPQRPFVVRVGEIAVRAVGTAFAIELKPDAVTVIVTHGRVALDGGSEYSERRENAAHAEPLALVSAGNLAVVERTPASATAAIPIVSPASETDIDAALAWRRPRLEFSGTPLAEAIAMMNRHNDVKFVLADESLASLRLSGALRADKVDALVQILEADFPVRAERRGERVIELHRR
jgi:transmembrane sensor